MLADRYRRPRWLSNGCYLLGLAWCALHGCSAFSAVWMLQHDVGWSGSLAALLGENLRNRWSPLVATTAREDPQAERHSALAHSQPDLVCLDVGQRNSSWMHTAARNARHASAYPRQFSCLLPAARYSQRLLLLLLDELRAGLTTYCEARAATACATRPWCTISELRGSGLLGPFSFFTSLNESAAIETRHRCTRGLGRLYHRVS